MGAIQARSQFCWRLCGPPSVNNGKPRRSMISALPTVKQQYHASETWISEKCSNKALAFTLHFYPLKRCMPRQELSLTSRLFRAWKVFYSPCDMYHCAAAKRAVPQSRKIKDCGVCGNWAVQTSAFQLSRFVEKI